MIKFFKNKDTRMLAWILLFSLLSIVFATVTFVLQFFIDSLLLENIKDYVSVSINAIIIVFVSVYMSQFVKKSKEREKEFSKQKISSKERAKLLEQLTGEPKEKWYKIMDEKKRRKEFTFLFILVILANLFSIFSNLFI